MSAENEQLISVYDESTRKEYGNSAFVQEKFRLNASVVECIWKKFLTIAINITEPRAAGYHWRYRYATDLTLKWNSQRDNFPDQVQNQNKLAVVWKFRGSYIWHYRGGGRGHPPIVFTLSVFVTIVFTPRASSQTLRFSTHRCLGLFINREVLSSETNCWNLHLPGPW